MRRYYYAKENQFGSSTSHGFENTWNVLVFDNKKSRDDFVKNSDNITVSAIKKSEVTRYSSNYSMTHNRTMRPEPFSGEYWGIENFGTRDIPGYVGFVTVCDPGIYGDIERLF